MGEGVFMNSIKFQRIKEEIMMADQICSDISLKNSLKIADYISQSYMSEDEIKKFYNRYGEQLALACEHYLKSMIIARMHYEGISNESEEELNKIFDNRDNQGIAKKYSHYFDKLLTSENTALLNSNGLQESILIRLAERLRIPESGEYTHKQMDAWVTDNFSDVSIVKEELLRKIKSKVNENRGAYPEARYGMFTENYKADIEFLANLCLTLQEYPTRTLNNCMFIKGLGRHIFPDIGSKVHEKRSDDTDITYAYSGNNKLDIIECNGVKKEDLSKHMQFNDLFPNTTQKQDTIEISYVENGEEITMKYDQMLNCFCKTKKATLKNEISRSK